MSDWIVRIPGGPVLVEFHGENAREKAIDCARRTTINARGEPVIAEPDAGVDVWSDEWTEPIPTIWGPM